ncbi:MAG: hypothetical protein Q9217_001008, partial [Psora testacea]
SSLRPKQFDRSMAAAVHNSTTDFVLFPQDYTTFSQFPIGHINDEDLISDYNMAGIHRQESFLEQTTTSYDSYDSLPSHTLGPSDYYHTPQYTFNSSKEPTGESAHRPTPSASPSSFSQTYDHPPSVMSSASGASGQSTSSSADASPHTHPTHQFPYHDKWAEPLHGLGLGPGIVNHDSAGHELYPVNDFDHDMSLAENKGQYCVGEYPRYSSTVVGPTATRTPPSFFDASSQEHVSALFSPPLTENTSVRAKDVTIDSILEEFNCKRQAPTPLLSPVSANWPSPSPLDLVNPLQFPSGPGRSDSSNFTSVTASSLFSPKSAPLVPSAAPNSGMQRSFDPSLIQHFDTPITHNTSSIPYPGAVHTFPHVPSQRFAPSSPVPSEGASHEPHRAGSARLRSGTNSPYLRTTSYQPYPPTPEARRFSIASSHSRNSMESRSSNSFDEDGREKTRCPHPDCGRPFKDLKAHMLTHQSERPEKCPIATCAYHVKGFARKYDKNRHTLTHYKGTMVCGFCPGSGSSSEKSFNRADVFKRHLTSVHGVEQSPPNGRKKSPGGGSNKKTVKQAHDVSGKCSTCSATFSNAQDFYEHLDDCVLRVVQQEDPSEAINESLLRSVNNDESVRQTLDRHMLSSEIDLDIDNTYTSDAEENEENEEELKEEPIEDESIRSATKNGRAGKGGICANGRVGGGTSMTKNGRASGGRGRGMTASKGGVPLLGKGRRRRKHYPISWGCSAEQMKMKKRVLCVYDGPRRLWKDDMMLDNEFEVRMRIGNGQSYVTDLDVETIKRAEAFHDATEEEKDEKMEPFMEGFHLSIGLAF